MRLVESIVDELDDGLVCKVVVDDDFIFLRDGGAEVAVCVELVAQSVGCCVGLADLRRGEEPRPGLLVGCREAQFYGDALCPGDVLLVRVRRLWVREPVASFSGEVTRDGERLASVEVCVVSGLSAASYEEARER